MSDFEVGEVVYLNSGSPPLTVRDVKGDMVAVSWDGVDGLEVTMFLSVCLSRTNYPDWERRPAALVADALTRVVAGEDAEHVYRDLEDGLEPGHD